MTLVSTSTSPFSTLRCLSSLPQTCVSWLVQQITNHLPLDNGILFYSPFLSSSSGGWVLWQQLISLLKTVGAKKALSISAFSSSLPPYFPLHPTESSTLLFCWRCFTETFFFADVSLLTGSSELLIVRGFSSPDTARSCLDWIRELLVDFFFLLLLFRKGSMCTRSE